MSTIVEPTKVSELQTGIRGKIVQPEDEMYDVSRKVYNGMIDKKPRMLVYCKDVADVIKAVNYARRNKLTLAVRGGGHNGGGLGICDDGLVIDLSAINYTHVDPIAKTALVGGGSTWGDVDHATNAFGLATPSGIISTTGVGGLTLGGGLGHLSRKLGLAIDNLLEADVVLANGEMVKASEKDNPDLFWAIRGGGGNFGIVTSFLFRLHEIDTIIGGPTFWHLDEAEEVMKWYRSFITQAPEDLNGFFAFLTVPPAPPFPEHLHMQKVCGVVWCYTGPEADAEKIFEPIKNFGSPLLHGVQPMPYPALQSAFDELYPPGLQWYWRADFVKELPDEAIVRHVDFGKNLPSLHSTMHLYPIDGAVHRRGRNDMAWSYRDVHWAEVIVGVDPDPSNNPDIISWTKDYWESLHPYSAGGAYINFLMDEGQERIKATYRDNYERLSKIKGKYDPDNVFCVNQNIIPAK